MTLPGAKLLVDCDGRSHSIVGRDDVHILSVLEPNPSVPRAKRLLDSVYDLICKEISEGIFPFDSVVFDGLSAVNHFAMNWALTLDAKRGLGGCPAKQHYLPAMDWLGNFVTKTLTLPRHVVWTGHIELAETEEGGVHMYLPKTIGRLRFEIPNWFNECYFCRNVFDEKLGRPRFFWETSGSGRKSFFKSAMNARFAYWSDPIEIDFTKPPVGFERLLGFRFAKAQEKASE
jgi:hypothetical protein